MSAADGSSEVVSERVLPSWMMLGRCVGEWFLGVEPGNIFFERLRVRLVFSGIVCTFWELVLVISWLCSSGLVVVAW